MGWEPTREQLLTYLRETRNWGRWGADDQLGTLNLITPEKRVQAARLVRTGRAVSLSRAVPTSPGAANPRPAQHFLRLHASEHDLGSTTDYCALEMHGRVSTHIDALCHILDGFEMWNGRDVRREFSTSGVRWGAIEQMANGLMTRGVLLDVPRYRGEPYVALERPVRDSELADVAREQGVRIEPGDAIVVYQGRERWSEAQGPWSNDPKRRPGLHASCLRFIRETDCSLLVWDMLHETNGAGGDTTNVHMAVVAYGLPLLDNALLEPLARACAEERRYEFLLTVNPLVLRGGTGSPVNPIATF